MADMESLLFAQGFLQKTRWNEIPAAIRGLPLMISICVKYILI